MSASRHRQTFAQRLKTPKEGRSLHFSKGDKADIREQPNYLTLFNACEANRVLHRMSIT